MIDASEMMLVSPARRPLAPALATPQAGMDALGRGWLWLGLSALAGSGIFAVLLVFARTPQVNQWLPVEDFFRVALIVHVNLSVLVWFVAMAGALWSMAGSNRARGLAWTALGLSVLGTALMVVAPFIDHGAPVMANYIPVVDGTVFRAGLALFGLGGAALVLRALLTSRQIDPALTGDAALRFGLNASAVASAVAVLAFGASLLLVPRALDAQTYYEILFWGGGHALQFVWTILMLVGWLWLAGATGAQVSLSPRVLVLLFLLALASVFATPYAYLAADVTSVEFRAINTWAMRLGGGVSIVPIALAVMLGIVQAGSVRGASERPLRAALVASIVLFGAGGVIGAMIDGNNVRIPAHYHGCIVAVTLALMGLVYVLLPRFGYRAPAGRLACLQPVLYGSGQLLHIIGLVWSGGYGVQRKVAGAGQVLRSASEVAGMGLMGLGGLIAIIGGMLFVVVVAKSMRAGRSAAEASS